MCLGAEKLIMLELNGHCRWLLSESLVKYDYLSRKFENIFPLGYVGFNEASCSMLIEINWIDCIIWLFKICMEKIKEQECQIKSSLTR